MKCIAKTGMMGMGRARWAMMGIVLALGTLASAQTTAPVARDPIESTPIRLRPSSQPARTAATPGRPESSDWMDIPRVAGALAVVIGLIFTARWVGKKYFPNLSVGRAPGVVRVLARSPISPRQHVLLVQVGRRVLVVADNGTQVSRLTDITDPDEVASLLGQLAPRSEPQTEAFDEKLDDATQQFAASPSNRMAEVEAEAESLPATEEIEGLMSKVRALARQLGRS